MKKNKKESLTKDQPTPVSLEGTRTILYQMENCICKIHKNNGTIGAGFFCEIPLNDDFLTVLITNNHILNEKEIGNNKIIDISIINEEKEEELKKIKIDNTRKKYTNKDLDITIIEIKPNKDNINNFMEIDNEDSEKNKEVNYKKKSVYILHYPKGELCVSYGLINDIKDGKINHYCNIEVGSSGSPILSLENNKIIGIHNSDSSNKSNFGIFINTIIDEFNNNIKSDKNYNIENNKDNNTVKTNKKIKDNDNNDDNDDDKYKNEINLIYNNKESETKIFGKKFVISNRNNIELIVNGKESKLVENYKLNRGENNVKIIIKNKLIDLEDMFNGCKSLSNIDELKYLNTKEVTNFSGMFYGCTLSDINPLEDWNVSKGNKFSYMFGECSELVNIKGLEKWNVSNGNDFKGMFYKCKKLSSIQPLQKWKVLNGNDFSYMFMYCSELSDLKPIQKWKVSKGNDFSGMFYECEKLTNIKVIEDNWKVSNKKFFNLMLYISKPNLLNTLNK